MPSDNELEDVKRLEPSERIRRLKELEEKKKQEIDEAEHLLKETELEIEDEENQRINIPIPQIKAEDPEMLETIEAKLVWSAKRGVGLKPKEADVVSSGRVPAGIAETVEAEHSRIERKAAAQYGSMLDEELRRQGPSGIIDAYMQRVTPVSTAPGEAYESLKKKGHESAVYQKPEARIDFAYEARKATPGEETKPQDFYTSSARKKKDS
ncbi:hypothetical protein HYY72_05560 [Candidatus Woesearchaeota archaeon]|nr:hypothetical protein [Candidatus Woesearchaeota archaeon]